MAFNSIIELSHDLVYRLGGDKYQGFIHVYLCWKRVVGDLLSSRSHPIKLENHILYVGVQNNTWMQELLLLKQDIISKYKTLHQEEIAEIIFLISSPKRKCTKRK
ncbi:MAG: DUF721 domain-containing protein [Candidatus Cloacimonetes bacterium HGW-Cloacimonetes-3]|jgi:hypothetical protein|nr:MAG: DUF721 domain-containing protein [Candidatus Cloacimonetes bacterium HGW-Cloacimonetes-3]